MRYRKAANDSVETAVASNRPGSPVTTDITARTADPATIWLPVAISGCWGRTARWVAYSEPIDQAIGDTMMAARPAASRASLVPSAVGPARTATPTNPTTMPMPAIRGSRSPRKSRPSTATHTGIRAISRAAMPDGMVCSPHATMPIPPPSRSAPTMLVSRTSRRLGRRNSPRCRSATHPRSTKPASPKRSAAMRNGGIVSTATAIAR